DESIRRYNVEMAKKQKRIKDNPCDTLALREFIIDQDTAGTYLVEFDRTFTYNVPKSAVIYYSDKRKKKQYIFAVITKSKPTERFIEPKNVVGYESSFINLDSTKLGTAFFFLTLYECSKEIDGTFRQIWESEVPIHGGFNTMKLKRWKPKGIMYVELNFEAGIISGHRNYNFFLVDGIEEPPHLMETYVGLVHKRTLTKVNNDEYPDYWEFRFWDDSISIRIRDSIPFYWDTTKSLYITKYNRRWFRKY
ncbi:MAG: hypothetical protein KAI45_05455, partial [Melioribacteraceae bacterium]|nr:hypothetical protein [Melioribacteraceae bacterium]